MKRCLSVFLSAIVMSIAMPASAGIDASDPDDKPGFLDLKELVAIGAKGDVGTFTIKTYDGYACNYLKGSKDNYLKLLFDDGRDGDTDLVAQFKCVDNKLMVFLHGTETDNNYEPFRADRPKAKIARSAFSLDLVEFESNHMGVKVLAKDATNVDCKPDPCKDRIPSSGDLKVY